MLPEWMSEIEVCANLWLIADQGTRIVHCFGARLYVLSGDDESKLSTLRSLAQSDYLAAQWFPIPERYRARWPEWVAAGRGRYG